MANKKFSRKMEKSEKQNIIDLITSHEVNSLDNFESEAITEISDRLQSTYSFEKYPFRKSVNEDSFKCFANKIHDDFGCGLSMTREMMDGIKFLGDALNGAAYSGIICAVNTGLVIARDGGSILKVVSHAVGYGLLGAVVGGVYNGYSEASLAFDNKFDGAISNCFGAEVINLGDTGLAGKVHTIRADDIEF